MYDWTSFYEELATALLKFKNNRKALVNWIYSDLKEVKGDNQRSLIDYLHNADGSNVQDIDPFSVFAIFNRRIKEERRKEIVEKIKSFFSLKSSIPSDFHGVPTVDNRLSMFYVWKEDNFKQIENLWNLLENIIQGKDFEKEFNEAISIKKIKTNFTIALYWIRPFDFLPLDKSTKTFLNKIGFDITGCPSYTEYSKIIQNVKTKIKDKTIPYSSFPEITHKEWHNMYREDTDKEEIQNIWLFDAKYKPFESNEIAMGDSVQMDDFSKFKSKEALREAYQAKKGNTDVSIPNAYWQFIKEVNAGDIIVIYDGVKNKTGVYHKLCGWGVFTSDIIYVNGENARIMRKVEWKSNISENPIICRETKNQLFFHKATDKQAESIIKLLGIHKETTSIQPQERNNMEYQKYIDILKNCHNLVLTGAPGTGKTYLAREIAKQMNAETEFVQFHPSYDYSDFVEGLRPVQSADNQIGFERKDGIFKAFCAKALKNLQDSKKSIETLEKESSTRQIVEDFINDAIENNTEFATSGTKNKFKIIDNKESIFLIDVPANKTSTLSLSKSVIITLLNENKVINGGNDIQEHFERTYRTQQDSYYYVLLNEIKKVHKASQPSSKQKVESKNFVFIIDEINRGEVSKIFGELFYAIDPGYRNDGNGKDSVKTQYQNLVQEDDVFYKGFFVPSNVYIIATMNDIDRSVESMDFAMRRRFCWLEVKPEERKNMLERLGNFKNEAINRMDALNKAITNEESLGSAFQIGPAYFLKLNNGDFNTLWEMHLEPLLREYLRGFRNADEKLKTFKNSFELQQTSLTNNDITEG